MGRNTPTLRMKMEGDFQNWNEFMRSLRRSEKRLFKKIKEMARKHASSSSHANFLDSFKGAALSIFLEQQKEIEKLKEEIEELRGMLWSKDF